MNEWSTQIAETTAPSAMKLVGRLRWVDIAKGIAIICVIVGHTVPHGPLRSALFSFHLPVFFVLSGFTTRLRPVGSMVPSLVKRLLVPYVLLTVGYWFFAFVLGHQALPSIESMTLSLLWGSGVPVGSVLPVGASWFLVCMFFARLLFVGGSNLMVRLGWKAPIQGLLWLGLLVVSALLHRVGIVLPFCWDEVPTATFLMWCGHTVKAYWTDWERLLKPGFVAILVVLWALGVKFSDFEMAIRLMSPVSVSVITALLGTALIAVVSCYIDANTRHLSAGLAWCGRESMVIYGAHILDLVVPIARVTAALWRPWVWASMLRVVADVSAAAVYVWAKDRLRTLRRS